MYERDEVRNISSLRKTKTAWKVKSEDLKSKHDELKDLKKDLR